MADYTGLTLTSAIRFIHSRLGSKLIVPELNDDEIARIITKESLITYSKFFPYYNPVKLTPDDEIKGQRYIFKIPNRDFLEVMQVKNMYTSTGGGMYGISNQIPVTVNPVSGQQYEDIRSMTYTPTTWRFLEPNLLEVFPKSGIYKVITVYLETVHPPHLKTIGLNMREHFLDLCYYDVLLALRPLRHRFETLTTEFGTISLFLEQIDSAESNRNQLLQLFKDNRIRSSKTKKLWYS